MGQQYSEIRDGMRIDWDVPIEMDDGLAIRADVYRPPEEGEYPVIASYGPYGKWLHFEQGYPDQWDALVSAHPDVLSGSSGKYMSWEVADPEKWVPDGYALLRADSRGAGRSPGTLNPSSFRERRDFATCIEWAGQQPWSNGKVGLLGISYYAKNQWQVATIQPEPLEAICVWEGFSDFYRDVTRHGGIYNTFLRGWYENQVETVQHGVGEDGFRSPMTGGWVAGPETLTEEELGEKRVDYYADTRTNELATEEYWTSRTPDLSKIDVPLLSAANWGGQGIHPRGNIEGFTRAASEEKFLEVHGLEHWTHFYTDYGVDLQKRFFGHYLKGEDTGWNEQPPVQLQVRRPGEVFVERDEEDWPLSRTDWTRYYMDADGQSLSTEEPNGSASVAYDALGDGVTFLTDPLDEETEITGPISSKLFVESDTADADLFLIVRVFAPDFEEVVFQGALDPHTPVAQGWLRASHRKLDEEMSDPWRPWHTHDEIQPLEPGDVYELEVEVWPTCIVVPRSYRVGLSVRGTDYEYPGDVELGIEGMEGEFTGVGPLHHNDSNDRPPNAYGGDVTVHTGPEYPSSVLLPVVPPR